MADTKLKAVPDAPADAAPAPDAPEETGHRFITGGELAGAIVITGVLMLLHLRRAGDHSRDRQSSGGLREVHRDRPGVPACPRDRDPGRRADVTPAQAAPRGPCRRLLRLSWRSLVLVGVGFTKLYDELATSLGPRWTALVKRSRDWWNNRSASDDEVYQRLRTAILAAWCDQESDLINLVRDSPGLYLVRLSDEVMLMVGRVPDDAELALSISYGDPVAVDGFRSPNGVWLRLPEDEVPPENEVPGDLAVDRPDDMCMRIAKAISDAWGKWPDAVTANAYPGVYIADLPEGLLDVPYDRSEAVAGLTPAAVGAQPPLRRGDQDHRWLAHAGGRGDPAADPQRRGARNRAPRTSGGTRRR